MHVALLVVAVATIGCDRVTKHLAAVTLADAPARSFLGDTVRLDYAENAGGFLSLGAGLPAPVRTAVFTVATGLMLLTVIAAAVRFRWRGWLLAGLTLFVAGGASNWLDRVLHGRVIDFMNVGLGPVRTGIFNVADLAVMLGLAFVVLGEVLPASPPDRDTVS
jgi:signal peptidase II